MKQAVKRKTLTGNWEEFKFPKKARYFFVKNYTDGDVFVSFENGDDESESIKIKSGLGEEISCTFDGIDVPAFHRESIFVKGTGEVEVQALDIYAELPKLALSFESASDSVDLFGKVASDLQEGVSVSDSKVEGTSLYVEGYEGFSSKPEEQEGNYLALKVIPNYEPCLITAQVIGGLHGAVTLDSDRVIVFRLLNDGQKLRFVAESDHGKCETELSLEDLVFGEKPEPEEEPAEEEPSEEPSEEPAEEESEG